MFWAFPMRVFLAVITGAAHLSATVLAQPAWAEEAKGADRRSSKHASSEDGLAPLSAPRPQQIVPIVEPVKREPPQTPKGEAPKNGGKAETCGKAKNQRACTGSSNAKPGNKKTANKSRASKAR